jgi:8-oxo-dGTP diphosphatase
MKKVEVVAAIIINQGQVLCCQREKNKLSYLSEKWEFPGGKIEEGETKKQALIREIKEELEMEIHNLEFALTIIHRYEDFELTMHTYVASTEKPDFKLNTHKSAVWSRIEDINKFEWAAADQPIVEYVKMNY